MSISATVLELFLKNQEGAWIAILKADKESEKYNAKMNNKNNDHDRKWAPLELLLRDNMEIEHRQQQQLRMWAVFWGTLEGSVISPLLFALFVNEFPLHVQTKSECLQMT